MIPCIVITRDASFNKNWKHMKLCAEMRKCAESGSLIAQSLVAPDRLLISFVEVPLRMWSKHEDLMEIYESKIHGAKACDVFYSTVQWKLWLSNRETSDSVRDNNMCFQNKVLFQKLQRRHICGMSQYFIRSKCTVCPLSSLLTLCTHW